MAARLQTLSASVPPSLRPHFHHVECSTAVAASDLETWQVSASRLEALRSEEAAALEASVAVELEAEEAERACAEALALVDQLAGEAVADREAQLQEDRAISAAVFEATRRAEAARAAAEAAEEKARRRAAASSNGLVALRASLAREVQATTDAENKAASALADRCNAKDLPALRKRQNAAEAKADSVEEDNKRLRSQIASIRAEVDASLEKSRVETMEARVSQLEQECRDLEKGGGSSSSAGENAAADVTAELASVQEGNRQLLLEVKEARVARDEVQSDLNVQEKEKAKLQLRVQHNRRQIAEIRQQLLDNPSHGVNVKKEVDAKAAEIAVLEKKCSDFEDEVKSSRLKQQEATAQMKLVKAARQTFEQKSDLCVWQLQNALQQLEREKPGAPLNRCLMSSRPREKWKAGCKPRHLQTGGSDAGSEQTFSTVDADVSTTAGESVANLIDLGHACA